MKKAVVIYSKTGNTRSVAERFSGFDLLEVKAESDDPNQTNPVLTEIPKVEDYDYLVFAGPVNAFQLAKVMNVYLKQLPDLNGKVIDIFITHHFPFAFLGGNQALKQMTKIINSKGTRVRFKTSVDWSSRKRELKIAEMIEKYVI